MDAKKLLLEHFDKLALAVAGLVLIGFVVMPMLTDSEAENENAKVAQYNRDIKQKRSIAEDQLARFRKRERKPHFEEAIKRELAGGPFAENLPEWTFHKRPLVAAKVIGVVVPPAEHLEPVDVAGSPGLGRISISWAENPSNQLVEVELYKLFRSQEGGEWAEIAELDGAVHSFTDEDTQPRKQYRYYLESHADVKRTHPSVIRHGIELEDENKLKKSIELGPYETKRDVYVEVTQVIERTRADEIEGNDTQAQAWLKVYKYFPDKNEWIDSSLQVVKPGEPVGGSERRGRETVIFTTPYELVKTKVKKIQRQIPGEEGGSFTIVAHVATLKDTSTGETFEINNEVKDPGLLQVKEEMRGGAEEGR